MSTSEWCGRHRSAKWLVNCCFRSVLRETFPQKGRQTTTLQLTSLLLSSQQAVRWHFQARNTRDWVKLLPKTVQASNRRGMPRTTNTTSSHLNRSRCHTAKSPTDTYERFDPDGVWQTRDETKRKGSNAAKTRGKDHRDTETLTLQSNPSPVRRNRLFAVLDEWWRSAAPRWLHSCSPSAGLP